MPLPGSHRDVAQKKMLQEINQEDIPVAPTESSAEFLQEIKAPVHEEEIVEEAPKKRRRSKKK